jgi:hypothetical protein
MSTSSAAPRPVRIAPAVAASVLPTVAVPLIGWMAVFLSSAIGAAALRYLGSWRARAWVGASVAIVATAWGWWAWLQGSSVCGDASPVLPALSVGVCAVAGAAAGAVVAGLAGSAWRVVAGGLVGAGLTIALGVASSFLLIGLGIPAFFVLAAPC